MKRPRTKPAEVRRDELMDAAEALFLAQGVAATSVDAIVAAADVAKGTFYLHFASKEKLLAALQDRYVRTFCDGLAAALERRPPDDWLGRLHAWIAAAVDGHLDRIALHDVVFHEFHISGRHSERDNPTVAQLAALLQSGANAGAWTIVDAYATAVMLFHAMHGAIDEAIVTAPKVNRKKLTAAIAAFFDCAVAAREGLGSGH